MRIGRDGIREGRIPMATIFMAGLFAGILLINFGKSILLKNTGLLDEYTLYHMKYMTVDSSALFYYVLRNRISRVLILALLSTTYLGMVVYIGAGFWYGMCAGAFLGAAVIRYGLKGILLVLTGIFPHYLIYVPAVLALLLWCKRIHRTIYFDRESHFVTGFLVQLTGILLAIIVGAVLESFINPHLMIGLLKKF